MVRKENADVMCAKSQERTVTPWMGWDALIAGGHLSNADVESSLRAGGNAALHPLYELVAFAMPSALQYQVTGCVQAARCVGYQI